MKIGLLTFPCLFDSFFDGDDTEYHQILEPSVLYLATKTHDCEFIYDNKPKEGIDLYICSVYTRGYNEFRRFSESVGSDKIIAGGYHVTALPEHFNGYADKIVTGYCSNIDEIIEKPKGTYQGEFGFSEMDRNLIDMKRMNQVYPDIVDSDIKGSMVTSVGCPYACDFCSTPNMSGRKMKVGEFDYVHREIDNLLDHGVTTVFLRDESFATHPKIKEIATIMKDKFRILYSFGTLGIMSKREDVVKHLAECGWHSLNFGLEDIGTKYNKNRDVMNAVKNCQKYGLKYNMSFIVNEYGKDQNALRANYNALYDSFCSYKPSQLNANFMMPLPGTKLWEGFGDRFSIKDFDKFDSKTPLFNDDLVDWNKRMLVAVQLKYYYSDIYNKEVREFNNGDNLSKRMLELEDRFELKGISHDKLLELE